MDRRQARSRAAIFKAFSRLLKKKRYEHITVQEIIDEADVGRSTFYAHFETKDMLLREMCGDIFDHIFTGNPCDKSTCSQRGVCDCGGLCDSNIQCGGGALCKYETGTPDLQAKLAHILWHLKESKSDIVGILTSESADLFMNYLKEYLEKLFKMYLPDFNARVPENFLLNHLVGSFAETIRWWVNENMETSSEQTAIYFMEMTETH